MKDLLKYKNSILAIILIGLAFFAYNYFFGGGEVLPTTDSSNVENLGADLVRTYEKLQKITFDQTLFSSPLYEGLVDFGVILSDQPKGRTNPFDILGKD